MQTRREILGAAIAAVVSPIFRKLDLPTTAPRTEMVTIQVSGTHKLASGQVVSADRIQQLAMEGCRYWDDLLLSLDIKQS